MSIANFTFLNKSLCANHFKIIHFQKNKKHALASTVPFDPPPHLYTLLYAHAHFGQF